jgi:hypothetical protein
VSKKDSFVFNKPFLTPSDRKIIGWSLSSGMSVEETRWWLGEWLKNQKHHK